MSTGMENELENVLQHIFVECNASVSTSMPDSTDDAMPISRIVEYVQDQLPSWSIDNLVELWKCLVAVSTNDRVNFHQFKEATKRWIAKVQQTVQDGNNNTREKLYLMSDADSSMKNMDVDKDIVELELREKFRELCEQNIGLHDEIEQHKASIDSLKQQHGTTKKQLKHYIQKCQQLEKENDEQRDQLNESIKKEKTMALALQRYTKEHQNLLKQLEVTEIEIQSIPSLKEKLEKVTKEKMDCMKLIAKMQEEFDEKEDNCKQLKTTIIQLKDTSNSMMEDYKFTIRSLREKIGLLTDENTELQSSAFSVYSMTQERLSMSPISDVDGYYMHSTPCKLKEVPMQDSLYTELKASGFIAECSRNDRQELEEELNEYDAAICTILEQLEKVIQFFIKMRGSIDDLSHFNSQETNARTCNVNVLKHKAAFLLYMATEASSRRNTCRDSSTQLQADPTNTTGSLDQFGIRSFQDLHAYRSIHTLSSSLQSTSLTVEDSRFDQSPGTNITDAAFAQGDGLTQEDRDDKSTPLIAEVFNQEDPLHSKENRSYEMSKVSNVLQMDLTLAMSKEEEEKQTNASFQVPEVSSASNPTSPRRKISVYCRSFDVVAVQNQCEDHPGSNLEVRQSPSNSVDNNSLVQVDRIAVRDQNSTPSAKYPFNHFYRNAKSDSDSSNSTPQKLQDSLLDDEPPIEVPILRKVRLAPTRLRFPQETGNDLDRTAETSICASSVPVNSTEFDISNLCLSPIGEHKEDDDASIHSSSMFINKCKMEINSVIPKSCMNENVSQAYSMSNHCLFTYNQADSAKIVDSKDPHSQTSVRRVNSESQSRIEQSVDSQMSSREDSLAVSDSKREPVAGFGNRCGINEKVTNEIDKAVNVVSSTSLTDPVSTRVMSCKNVAESDKKAHEQNLSKQEVRQWLVNTRRSYSEGRLENLGRLEHNCRCKLLKNAPSILESSQHRVFPNLTDVRLQESGLANLSDFEESRENLSELELQKKYTAFSLCLSIDRLTLSRRIAMSYRQRDQSEKNLSCEVRKMQQDIQELAPLCTDRESVERVERVRHQLDMIVRCAHRVSCAAETLGAVHQERRVSRAVLLADKYLQVLQSRCEKLIANVTEAKRILVENNIVIEENSGELNDELPRIRYRSGTLTNNRMMMARRRASVATMSRPMGSTQDMTKEIVRQRNSVSGRMTLRRPSFNSESLKWEIEKLDRTESSNSINELRGIFEQVESRRSSKEENNNMLRPSHSNSQSTINCAIIDNEDWTNVIEETSPELSDTESINNSDKSSTRSSHSFQLRKRRRRQLSIWHIILSSILILCVVFYVIQAGNTCYEPLNERLIRCVFDRYYQIRNAAPYPM